MCGIAGFIGNGTKQTGHAMIESIRYRGPDYTDVYFYEEICLAHARLSIIDLDSRSNQPFFNKDRSQAIVFNGEIYNFIQLKNDLKKLNKYEFHTTSDTEVLLYAFKEYGKECLQKLNGMFAFAIYDFQSQELFLARDRMGKKPLYYSLCPDGTFVFGSEIKAVLKHPSVQYSINLESLNQYLTFDYVPGPMTIIQNVYKLKPAHYLKIKDKSVSDHSSYWSPKYNSNISITFDEAKSELDRLLNEATGMRLISDVPLGIFLSGGLDSSAVAYYAQKNAEQKIKTFSIGFEDKSYDEQDFALKVAGHLNTEHHVQVLTPVKTLELIEEVFPLLDEPFADASILPTFYLSEFTRKHVTVALGGDGGDELLAGYPTFVSDRFKKVILCMPTSLRNLLNWLSGLLPVSDRNISLDFKIKQFLRGFTSSANHIHQLWLGSFLPQEKQKLFRNDVKDHLKDKTGLEIIDTIFQVDIKDDFHRIIHYYCQTYLPDDILFKVDRASMYNSLEVRAPFLDKNIVEFLNSLPASFKHNGWTGKYLLKKLMEDKLPHEIVYRSKKGFGIPLSQWIRKDLKLIIQDTLLSQDDFFQRSYVERLLHEHYTHKHNHRKLIWNLFVLKKILSSLKHSN